MRERDRVACSTRTAAVNDQDGAESAIAIAIADHCESNAMRS